jgi:hypothetical protein
MVSGWLGKRSRLVAVLLAALGSSVGLSGVATGRTVSTGHGVNRRLVANLAVLRTPLTRSTRVKHRVSVSGSGLGLVKSAARAVHLRSGHTEVDVIPGRHGVCIQILTGDSEGAGCEGVSAFLEQYGDFELDGPPEARTAPVAGIFTDAAKRVELLAPNGTRRRLRLKLGAFETKTGAGDCLVITGVHHSRKVEQIAGPLTGACATAAGLPKPRSTDPTVAPSTGGPRSTFQVTLTSHARLGIHHGVLTAYILEPNGQSSSPSPAGGCTVNPGPMIDHGRPGQRLTITLRPLGNGWCPGAYTTEVLLQRGQLQSGPDGTVNWTVTANQP